MAQTKVFWVLTRCGIMFVSMFIFLDLNSV